MAVTVLGSTDADLSGKFVSTDRVKLDSRTLTNAEIKAGPSTSHYEIVAASAGKLLLPIWAVIISDFSAGIYTNVKSGGDFVAYVGIENNNESAFSMDYITNIAQENINDFFDLFSSNVKNITPIFPAQRLIATSGGDTIPIYQTPSSSFVGNIVITINNAGLGNFTGGNAANTLKVVVGYAEVTV